MLMDGFKPNLCQLFPAMGVGVGFVEPVAIDVKQLVEIHGVTPNPLNLSEVLISLPSITSIHGTQVNQAWPLNGVRLLL
jgi:hypothetical protein